MFDSIFTEPFVSVIAGFVIMSISSVLISQSNSPESTGDQSFIEDDSSFVTVTDQDTCLLDSARSTGYYSTKSRSSSTSDISNKTDDNWRISDLFNPLYKLFLEEDRNRNRRVSIRKRKRSNQKRKEYHPYLTKKGDDSFNMKRRFNIASEILTSEKNYCAHLEKVKDLFYVPLSKSDPPVLDKRGLASLFANFMDILNVSHELLRELMERLCGPDAIEIEVKSWDPASGSIGDILVNISPFLKVYSIYTRNFNFALQYLAKERQSNELFKKFMDVQERKLYAEYRLPLESFLIMPVQRLPRYRLLLSDLLKHTNASHPDFSNLKLALDLIESVADFVNEQIRDLENSMKVLSIQSKLVGFADFDGDNILLKPGRKLLKQGKATKVNSKEHQVICIFLFDDIIVIARPTKYSPLLSIDMLKQRSRSSSAINTDIQNDVDEVYYSVLSLQLNKLEIRTLSTYLDEKEASYFKAPHSFVIHSQESSFQVYFSSESDMMSWFKSIQDAITSLKNSSVKHLSNQVDKAQIAASKPVANILEEDNFDSFMAPVWLPDEFSKDIIVENVGRLSATLVQARILVPKHSSSSKERACDRCYFELYEKESSKRKTLYDSGVLSNRTPSKIRFVVLNGILKPHLSSGSEFVSKVTATPVLTVPENFQNSKEGPKVNLEVCRCEICKSPFGFFGKKVKCDKCSRNACLSCASRTKIITSSSLSQKTTRFCDFCFFDINIDNYLAVQVGEVLKV